jgi:hypothetical protein
VKIKSASLGPTSAEDLGAALNDLRVAMTSMFSGVNLPKGSLIRTIRAVPLVSTKGTGSAEAVLLIVIVGTDPATHRSIRGGTAT